jgi:hypothetical protein
MQDNFNPRNPETVKEMLEILPNEEVAKRALMNLNPEIANVECASIHVAMTTAFDWEQSPEGREFWFAVCEVLTNVEMFIRCGSRIESVSEFMTEKIIMNIHLEVVFKLDKIVEKYL